MSNDNDNQSESGFYLLDVTFGFISGNTKQYKFKMKSPDGATTEHVKSYGKIIDEKIKIYGFKHIKQEQGGAFRSYMQLIHIDKVEYVSFGGWNGPFFDEVYE